MVQMFHMTCVAVLIHDVHIAMESVVPPPTHLITCLDVPSEILNAGFINSSTLPCWNKMKMTHLVDYCTTTM